MTKYLKIVVSMVVVMAFASPASAKVINLYDLRNFLFAGSTCMGKGCKDVETTGCSSALDSYSRVPKGMVCAGYENNCYVGCRCSETLFPYVASDCNGADFKAPTEADKICTDSSGTYYTSCSYADYCKDSSYINENLSYFKEYFDFDEGNYTEIIGRNGDKLKCYPLGSLSCGGTENTKWIDQDIDEIYSLSVGEELGEATIYGEEPIYYVIATPPETEESDYLSGAIDICTTGQWFTYYQYGDVIFTSDPSSRTKCAEFESAIPKYSQGTQYEEPYYYYTGNCKSNCVASSNPCIEGTSETFKTYIKDEKKIGNGRCFHVTGCREGWDDSMDYMCGNYNYGTNSETVPPGITSNIARTDSYACISISGCDINHGYLEYDKGSVVDWTDIADIGADVAALPDTISAVSYGIDLTSGSGYPYIVCRKSEEPITCPLQNSNGVYQCSPYSVMGNWLYCGRQNSKSQ